MSNDMMERKILLETSGKEVIYMQDSSLIVELPEGRKTLSTSWLNGGYNDNIESVLNHTITHRSHGAADLEGGNVEEYLKIVSKRLGIKPENATGMLTTASMENAVVVSNSFRGLEVTVIVTGGVEINGGRAGDEASYYQEDERFEPVGGTINAILLIGADLPDYALTRALMTATEAKTAALQQLMAPSRYSSGIATGTGTDMMIIVADGTSPIRLTDAGKHSKLGELIGKCMIEAVIKSIGMQSGITAITQRDMLVRLERFKVDEAMYWKVASTLEGENKKPIFIEKLRRAAKDPTLVSLTASVLHIMDEVSWGLIPENAGRKAAFAIIREVPSIFDIDIELPFNDILNDHDTILDNWIRVTSWTIKNS